MRLFALVVLACLGAFPARAQTIEERSREEACPAERRVEASARLEELRDQDQADRSGNVAGPATFANDRVRRREVADIFAEGCFETGRDYHNAAQVFQHGEVPEHFYQTYIWARRAVELGDAEAARLVPRAIDRYLMTNLVSGAFYNPDLEDPSRWCLWPTSEAVDDERRAAMGVAALADQLERVAGLNDEASGEMCALDLPDPPVGMFPGVW